MHKWVIYKRLITARSHCKVYSELVIYLFFFLVSFVVVGIEGDMKRDKQSCCYC